MAEGNGEKFCQIGECQSTSKSYVAASINAKTFYRITDNNVLICEECNKQADQYIKGCKAVLKKGEGLYFPLSTKATIVVDVERDEPAEKMKELESCEVADDIEGVIKDVMAGCKVMKNLRRREMKLQDEVEKLGEDFDDLEQQMKMAEDVINSVKDKCSQWNKIRRK